MLRTNQIQGRGLTQVSILSERHKVRASHVGLLRSDGMHGIWHGQAGSAVELALAMALFDANQPQTRPWRVASDGCLQGARPV